MKKIILTGGGTAGHVIPNLALLPYFKGYEVHYIGSAGMEKKLTENSPVIYHEIPCVKLIRSLTPKNLLIPIKLSRSIASAKKILYEIKPDVIFSKGGFVGLPVALAKGKNTPLILHESDMTLGLSNKLAYKKCSLLMTSFDSVREKKAVCVGSPIRQSIYNGMKKYALDRCGLYDLKPYLLIFGGSLGAQKINRIVTECLEELTMRYNVIQITGKGNLSGIRHKNFFEIEFADNIQDYYALADAVISRGGANSLFELMSLKKPTLCIPLSKAQSRGDQIDNARYFADKGCLHVLQEENADKKNFLSAVRQLFENEKGLIDKMSLLKNTDGTKIIARTVLSYIH